MTEPLFSAGGVIEPPPGWLKRLQELCHERGMLLILDEEQTGLGKLGTMFAFEAEGVVPDIDHRRQAFRRRRRDQRGHDHRGDRGDGRRSAGSLVTHSHSNDPLACAAGIASLDVIEGEDVPAKARRDRRHMQERTRRPGAALGEIGDVRGRGHPLRRSSWSRTGARKEPATRSGGRSHRYCFERGLIFSLRREGSVLRFVPPVTTTEAQLDRAATLIDEALAASLQGRHPRKPGPIWHPLGTRKNRAPASAGVRVCA